METFQFVDALTGDVVTQDYATGEVFVEASGDAPRQARSVFFPGCSLINYAMPLVDAVYQTLQQHEVVDGISVLCCGKILSYEPGGDGIRASFEEQLREHVAACGIERFVCACPNCVKALRDAFADDPRTSDVEIAVLPAVLADLGYRIDAATAADLVVGDAGKQVMLCPHDSCPDREYGEFADGLRALLPEGCWVDPEHCRSHSVCCGSLPRAAGKTAAADKCAELCGRESHEVQADAIVTACMSCAFQLNLAQKHLPAVHFLELLHAWRLNWASAGMWMRLRFLFDETLGVTRRAGSTRTFAGLGGCSGTGDADQRTAADPSISDDDVADIGL